MTAHIRRESTQLCIKGGAYNGLSRGLGLIAAIGLSLVIGSCTTGRNLTRVQEPLTEKRCDALAAVSSRLHPDFQIDRVDWHVAGPPAARLGEVVAMPEHCEITGHLGEHVGRIGGPYRIAFRMRLPVSWNGRYLFQGGSGSNGTVGNAIGANGSGNPTALARGYAVIAQDSGHDNMANNLASFGGPLTFGHDPQARVDYGHASLKPVYDAGLQLIETVYGETPKTKLFWGCSKGGQEGMAFAQRYPDTFDGIVAAAPGIALPRVALAEAWETQQLARVLKDKGIKPSAQNLSQAFSNPELNLIRDAVLDACDRLDSAADGVVGAVGQCTTSRVLPALERRTCATNKGTCLNPAQINAITQIMDGPRDQSGRPLYAPYAWDTGISEPGWRLWKLGSDGGPVAYNVSLGAGALAAIFSTPPTPLADDPDHAFAWTLSLDLNREAQKIHAVSPPFTRSAWDDVGMWETDLSAFRRLGGKLIIPHGVSDPAFSVLDTINWWRAVDAANGGQASKFVRVFPVPGMNHCSGGAGTDQFDSLRALEKWVEDGRAPDIIAARTRPDALGQRTERPLCPFPRVAMSTTGGREYRCR